MEKFRTAWDGAQRQFSASLRPLQAREFECMAGCARQSGLSDEEYEACFKRCGTALARISDTYTREVTLFQVRTGRKWGGGRRRQRDAAGERMDGLRPRAQSYH